jgi:tRNA(adenine34) deaminase
MKYMHLAILEALKSGWKSKIPVGAVVVFNHQVVFCTHNEGKFMHAELQICNFVFLNNIKYYDLYLTLEPCISCWFLLNQTKIKRLFFGCYNKHIGISTLSLQWQISNNVIIFGGVCEIQNQLLLKSFFLNKRKIKGKSNCYLD